MAQQFNDKEKKQFKKELADVLKAVENLIKQDAVRLNEDRLKLAIMAKNNLKDMERNFDESQFD